ncbi:MAG: 2-phospho-L-lactate guanylyltransferase [bacterium]|nr:2-phospho-L-lactate guanylyltransferase [bacterium]
MALLPDSPWTVVLPVKSLDRAKTRLDPEGRRGALALAFFRDCLAAVVTSPRVGAVIVVTSDQLISTIAAENGCTVVDDGGQPGINAAAAWAAASTRAEAPVAVMVSDLPCLTPDALTEVLDVALREPTPTAFLVDADGTGTTMWLRSTGSGVNSQFGPDSAAAHRRSGAADLAAANLGPAIAPARRDVDTDDDLARAVDMGVGAHTLAALASAELIIVTALRTTDAGWLEVADEQGRRHTIDWESVAAAGFREVRPGQRLVLDVTASTVIGLP